jgi:deoxyhypusine synthase
MKAIKDIDLDSITNFSKLIDEYRASGGFGAKNLATASDIFLESLQDKDCFNFLSFPACIIATGARGVIRDMVKKGLTDCIITTCGMLDHDLARIWKDYYHGEFIVDEVKLHRKGINRLGNIFVPNSSYGIVLERRMQPILKKLYKQKKEFSTREIIYEFGRELEHEKDRESSIVYWAYKKDIPIFVPGITDGAFGSQLWMFTQEHRDFKINLFKDEQDLSDIVFTHKKTGALMIGGGISKHHTIWWNQYKDGLDYAVYITTAQEQDGSLSGARMREAVSWGKIKENGKYVTVDGDATMLLPILIKYILEKKGTK